MEKILLHADTHRASQFERTVQTVQEDCNSLIQAFEVFQDWKRIETLQQFIELIRDPGGYFDEVLLSNIDLKVTGGKKPDPGHLANLLQIDRESYLNIVAGKFVSDPSCVPCQKLKIRRGTMAISYNQYLGYAEYLTFVDGGFDLDLPAIDRAKEKFNFFADADDKTLKHFEQLVKVLNSHDKLYHIAVPDKQIIAKSLKLQLSEGTAGKFMYSNEFIKNEILKSQYESTR